MKNFMVPTARAGSVVATRLAVRHGARCLLVKTRHHMFV